LESGDILAVLDRGDHDMRKRPRTKKELQKIAGDLRAGWLDGDPVAPFLRCSLMSIDRLIHEDLVSIRDVATALTMAGITYRTGRAWSEKLLRGDLAKARSWTDQRAIPETQPAGKPNVPGQGIETGRADSKTRREKQPAPMVTPSEKKPARRVAVTPVATRPPSAAHVPIPAATAPDSNRRPTTSVAPGAPHVSDLERNVDLLQSARLATTEAEREKALTALLGENWRASLPPVQLSRSRRPGPAATE
jgi:hypothetical protein